MGAVEEVMDIHQRVIENVFSSDVVVVSALIDMYTKCGRMDNCLTRCIQKMGFLETFLSTYNC